MHPGIQLAFSRALLFILSASPYLTKFSATQVICGQCVLHRFTHRTTRNHSISAGGKLSEARVCPSFCWIHTLTQLDVFGEYCNFRRGATRARLQQVFTLEIVMLPLLAALMSSRSSIRLLMVSVASFWKDPSRLRSEYDNLYRSLIFCEFPTTDGKTLRYFAFSNDSAGDQGTQNAKRPKCKVANKKSQLELNMYFSCF